MPRGRSKKEPKMATGIIEKAGPAVDAVAEVVAEKPETVTYQRILFRNLRDSGLNQAFTFNGLSYNIIDGEEVELRKEIVDHLTSCMVPDIKLYKDNNGDTVKKKVKTPRFMCQILDTFEKEAPKKIVKPK